MKNKILLSSLTVSMLASFCPLIAMNEAKTDAKQDVKVEKKDAKVERQETKKGDKKAPAIPFLKSMVNKFKKQNLPTQVMISLGTLFTGFVVYKVLNFVWAPIKWLAYIGGTLGAIHNYSNPTNKNFFSNMTSKVTGLFGWIGELLGKKSENNSRESKNGIKNKVEVKPANFKSNGKKKKFVPLVPEKNKIEKKQKMQEQEALMNSSTEDKIIAKGKEISELNEKIKELEEQQAKQEPEAKTVLEKISKICKPATNFVRNLFKKENITETEQELAKANNELKKLEKYIDPKTNNTQPALIFEKKLEALELESTVKNEKYYKLLSKDLMNRRLKAKRSTKIKRGTRSFDKNSLSNLPSNAISTPKTNTI